MRKAQLTGTKPNAVDVEQVSLNVYPKNAKKITFASVFLSAIFWWCMGGSSSRNMSQPFIVNATAKHTATVIFLHGLGDTGAGWSQAMAMIRQPHIKYVCPTAQVMPVSLNAGFRMPSWFDIKGLEPNSDEDSQGIKAASELLQKCISDEESKGVPRSRIVIGGFSQGGAVALYSALAHQQTPLAGVIGLSCWLPLHSQFPQAAVSNRDTPVLQCHGEADPLVRPAFGSLTAQLLRSFNANHKMRTYPSLGHSSCDEEMQDVKNFISQCLPPV